MTMDRDEAKKALSDILKIVEKQGYITFDDVVDCGDVYSLSIQDFDWLTSSITEMGILIYDETPAKNIESNPEEDFYDYAQGDYEYVYNRIVRLDGSLKNFVNKVRNIVPPQRGEVDKLKYQVSEGNSYARNRMIEMHLRLALKIALRRTEKYDLDIVDVVGDACVGLIIAVDKYNPDTNKAFGPYASMWILQNVSRNQPTSRPLVYYPFHEKEKYFSAYPILKENCYLGVCESNKDRKNRIKLLKTNFDFNDDDIECILSTAIKFESLDEIFYEKADDDFNFSERKKNEEIKNALVYSTENDIEKAMLKEQVAKVLYTLSSRERKILESRFGFIDGCTRTLEEVGEMFNITRERVRQIEAKTLRSLKKPSIAKLLKDFIY